MRVNVLHHASCFDGAASSSIFTAFYRACVRSDAEFVYIPKQHRPGNPFVATDFNADEVAILDFRYTKIPGLVWFFDHHKSSFQLDGEREHFLADGSGRKFFDPNATSCTGFIAHVAASRFGFEPAPHAELLHWADIIDSAAFPDPEIPVTLEAPALQVMTFVEQNDDPVLAGRLIEDLMTTPLEKLARQSYVREVVDPAMVRHRADIELLRSRLEIHGGVATFDLLDQPARAYNKFIPYYLHPDIRYLVGVSVGPDGRFKLSAGYNPWFAEDGREHDIATLCERFGGGGHPFVGGISFSPDDAAPPRQAKSWISSVLRGERTP